ncbi:hypothetical protein CKY28_11590 [Sphingomonas lenta]|uniref:Uncharacterized protein n=1 Tax=Sphingomonas lenta TaxID=1141887 RepID=A0A2A2SG20_9SPHN|nr:hypothetical protein CKY28_11590 [Sphingomonas lenta]
MLTCDTLDGVSSDGFGQSVTDDLRFLLRFRRCRRTPVAWRDPTPAEMDFWEAHPIVGRFADSTYAVAEVDGRRWVVRDRLWFGWPDPPEFAWFVLDGEAVWAAADFNDWPRAWKRPAASAPD